MKADGKVPRHRFLTLVAFLIAASPQPSQAQAKNVRPVPGPYFFEPAEEDFFMDLWRQGKLHHPYLRSLAERRAAWAEENASRIAPGIPTLPPSSDLGSQALGPDIIANDRSLSTGQPFTQAEPSVAAFGPFVVASWNDGRPLCTSKGQSFAYSSDYGATFHDGGLIPFLRGDPTVAVNAKTGAWYVSGLGATISVWKGHFTETGFVLDLRRDFAQSGEFRDKPWMAVDSTSGNVHITWTSFAEDLSSKIVLQRLDADLNPLGPLQELRYTPPFTETGVGHGAQGSFPAVGPDGMLYVGWSIYYSNSDVTVPLSHYEIVRSDDYGQTFGAIQKIADYRWNLQALAPGFRRGIWGGFVALAVDMTHGPYRGRVYATWAEIPDLPDPPPTSLIVEEVENNDFFASATPFALGGRIHGTLTGAGNNDFFTFTGQRGQVLRIDCDTLDQQRIRLICPADTMGLASYHLIANSSTQYVCGLPYDGTYYLQIASESNSQTGYQIATIVDQPGPGGRARDIKDAFVAWSDDGAAWSTPVRLNDDPPGPDAHHVSVSVDGRGRVHAFWFDWRDDAECGVISNQYMASSGDGGVTWGANRKLTDAPSFWGALASCSSINQGDYTHMAAAGDYVYSAFADARMGDPDVFIDASRFSPVASCPDDVIRLPLSTSTLGFSLSNHGNFDTPLAWRVVDSKGWLTGATPALEGSQTLTADGGTLVVQATFVLPDACEGESTLVRFITFDPFIPGYQDTCVTVLGCDDAVPTLVSLVDATVQNGTVTLRWHDPASAGLSARVSRRATGADWVERELVTADGSGLFVFEEHDVPPGRYDYGLELLEGEHAGLVIETRIEVPSFTFALHGARMDPSGSGFRVALTLTSAERARLELLDVAGRIVAAREIQGPGLHEVVIGGGSLTSGVYLTRLSQGGATAITKAVFLR